MPPLGHTVSPRPFLGVEVDDWKGNAKPDCPGCPVHTADTARHALLTLSVLSPEGEAEMPLGGQAPLSNRAPCLLSPPPAREKGTRNLG